MVPGPRPGPRRRARRHPHGETGAARTDRNLLSGEAEGEGMDAYRVVVLFLGSGDFKSNTWSPTTAAPRVADRTHPSTRGLTAAFTSSVEERYGRSNGLRRNPDIRVLASHRSEQLPPGTDPDHAWYQGYHWVLWWPETDTKYRMLHANVGHHAMHHASQTLAVADVRQCLPEPFPARRTGVARWRSASESGQADRPFVTQLPPSWARFRTPSVPDSIGGAL